MATSRLDKGIGLELMARSALIMLMEGVNAAFAEQDEKWAPLDEQLATLRGVDYTEILLDQVEPENFHLGHDPSLIEDSYPVRRYPAISVMAYRAGPSELDDNDHASEFSNSLYIESLVKASPEEGPEVCDRRIWRTVESINNVITSDLTLRGACDPISGSPTAIVSEVFTRPENAAEGYGRDWWWQAARLEYGVTKFSPFDG